jgi:hypothetical protein
MKADYLQYLAEDKESPTFAANCARARQCYGTALEIAPHEYPSTSPMYLGLVPNFTVFLYEIMEAPNEAI